MDVRSLYAAVIAPLLFPLRAECQIELIDAFPRLSFTKPVGLYHAGDGSDRLFVVEQEGRIRVFPNDSNATSARTFLDISDSVYYINQSEMGLLGLAFHPSYAANGYFYIHYIKNNPRRSVFARFGVSSDPDSADRSTETIFLEVNQPYSNHNGGQLAFGPDGFLYIGLGDGGSAGDPQNNAQSLTTLLGKILRIDVDGPSGEMAYGIPSDNPFAGNGMGYREEIYAYGLRNPWRFSFDFPTGQLWCGDVGQATREEVDRIESGMNYGWRIMEGSECYNPPFGCTTTGLVMPLWEYPRETGGSITGGFVYRGTSLPALTGRYVFGDYVSGYIASLEYDGVNPPAVAPIGNLPPYSLTSFGTDEAGEIYVCNYGGSILRLSPPPVSVVPTAPPQPYVLYQNFPNPFNAATRITFSLPSAGRVTLEIFDGMGRKIGTILDKSLAGGDHAADWNAGGLASGVYVCRLTNHGTGAVRTMAMLLLR